MPFSPYQEWITAIKDEKTETSYEISYLNGTRSRPAHQEWLQCGLLGLHRKRYA